MKLRNLALALTTAALLPTIAYAGDNTDAIRASFDRAFNHELSVMADADKVGATSVALNNESDQVLASFERSLYRDPVSTTSIAPRNVPDQILSGFERSLYRTSVTNEAAPFESVTDSLVVLFAELLGEKSDPILASFERDLNRGI